MAVAKGGGSDSDGGYVAARDAVSGGSVGRWRGEEPRLTALAGPMFGGGQRRRHLMLALSKCPCSANRRDVAVELRRPLALMTRNMLALCPGSRHLPAPCLGRHGAKGSPKVGTVRVSVLRESKRCGRGTSQAASPDDL